MNKLEEQKIVRTHELVFWCDDAEHVDGSVGVALQDPLLVKSGKPSVHDEGMDMLGECGCEAFCDPTTPAGRARAHALLDAYLDAIAAR